MPRCAGSAAERPIERRFLVALLIEAAWEIAENTPMVIDRYREATMALGYSGDSILNSASDIAMMALGFLAARRLPVWASVAIVLLLELVPLIAIRDNLTLNVVDAARSQRRHPALAGWRLELPQLLRDSSRRPARRTARPDAASDSLRSLRKRDELPLHCLGQDPGQLAP